MLILMSRVGLISGSWISKRLNVAREGCGWVGCEEAEEGERI